MIDFTSFISKLTLFTLGRPVLARRFAPCLIVIAAYLGAAHQAEAGERKEKTYADLPVTHDLRPKFVLFSWVTQDRSRRFVLVRSYDGTQEHRFIDKFNPRVTKGADIRTLEHELTALPRRSSIEWMKDEPHKLDHADHATVRRIKKVATRQSLDLQFNEMTYESGTGVTR